MFVISDYIERCKMFEFFFLLFSLARNEFQFMLVNNKQVNLKLSSGIKN